MLKGIALSTLADYLPTTSDIAELRARGVDALRLEIDAHAGPGALAYLTMHGIQLVALIGAALLPAVTNAEWNAPIHSASFQLTRTRWQIAVLTALRGTAGRVTIPFCEIWSEPNGTIGPGGSGLHPENYAHLYRAAHDVLAADHPATKVCSGGLFAHADSAAPYLHAVRKALPIHYDYVGLHPYLDSGGGLQTAHLDAYIRELYAAFGKKILISETGWDTSVVSQELQASNLASLFATARATTLVEGVLAFTLDDSPMAQPPLAYGLRGKVAWDQFRSY